tara:strand:+ start:66 stop:293 length:228 start_codon:yes stop_codon:yes gene_type:complete
VKPPQEKKRVCRGFGQGFDKPTNDCISCHTKINRQKTVEVSRTPPVLSSRFQMPNRSGLIVFVHNGNHWGLARPL